MEPAHRDVTVYWDAGERAARLETLGLNETVLREVVAYGAHFAADCTAHDPPSTQGSLMYLKGTRALRDRLVPNGWTASNAQNYASTIDPSGSFAVVLAAGDEMTGTRLNPTTRSEKGPQTAGAVANNQLTFGHIDPANWPRPASDLKQTWLLLTFISDVTEEVRCELSLPALLGDDKHVAAWRERIPLPPVPLAPNPTVDDEDEGDDDEPDIDIEKIS